MEYHGYLVVLDRPDYFPRSLNKAYRGLYRTPPCREEDTAAGFEHPYVFGGYTDESGLIPDLETANNVLHRFGEITWQSSLEIIYAATDSPSADHAAERGYTMLGFDVACLAPFWSIVVDQVPSDRIPDLNEYGLLSSGQEAGSWLADFRARRSVDSDIELLIWQVFLVGRRGA
jgi:hypothetical protein